MLNNVRNDCSILGGPGKVQVVRRGLRENSESLMQFGRRFSINQIIIALKFSLRSIQNKRVVASGYPALISILVSVIGMPLSSVIPRASLVPRASNITTKCFK